MPRSILNFTKNYLAREEVKMKVLVTGGAGFLGSHIVDRLMKTGREVVVLDNLSTGRLENLARWLENPRFKFVEGDLLDKAATIDVVKGCTEVYHLAANPEVKTSFVNPDVHFRQNVEATFNLLEAVRKWGRVNVFVFFSSSTVYGEANKIPTPENYAPLKPISIYGASKLACESLVTGYAYNYGFKAVILRLANVVGPRARHGVIFDFIMKLRKNPKRLEILGDGTQTKSYLYVDDFLDAVFTAVSQSRGTVEVFNVGSEDWVSVKRIAEIVVEEMGLENVEFTFTGGVDGGRGWKGDVKRMLLDVAKLKQVGWRPRYSSEEAVRLATRALVGELNGEEC